MSASAGPAATRRTLARAARVEHTDTAPDSAPIDRAGSVVNAPGDGAYVLDADRNRVFVTDRLREVTGFDEAVLHGARPERRRVRFHPIPELSRSSRRSSMYIKQYLYKFKTQ